MKYIVNSTIYKPDKVINKGTLVYDQNRIVAVGESNEIQVPEGANKLDAAGMMLVPGFIDLQVNGGFGEDFTNNPQSIWEVAAKLPRYGVTSFLPTIITSPRITVDQAMKVITQSPPPNFSGTFPLGLHIEGPFLNPVRKGTHNPDYMIPPSPEITSSWSPETGVRLVTLAPEMEGADEVIKSLCSNGVIVSAGHTDALYEEARAAFEAGISYGTHLFNAMSPLTHRKPGIVGALLINRHIPIGIIADGIHVHPDVISLVWDIKGNKNITLVTDAMAALGMPPGQYVIGDYDVCVDETSVRKPDGTLAGSILSQDTALRNLISFTGCTLEDALPTLTETPAKVLGLQTKGLLLPNYDADMLLLDSNLEVRTTIIAGQTAWEN